MPSLANQDAILYNLLLPIRVPAQRTVPFYRQHHEQNQFSLAPDAAFTKHIWGRDTCKTSHTDTPDTCTGEPSCAILTVFLLFSPNYFLKQNSTVEF